MTKLIISILLFLGIALFVCYLVYAIKKVGIPTSLSKTFYMLKPFKKGWMFQLTLILLGLLLIPCWIELSSIWTQFLCFLSCASIMFVGAAARYLDFTEGKVHIGATIVAASASVLWTVFAGKWFWIIPVLCLIASVFLVIRDKKNKIFYFEMAAFLSIFITLIIKLIMSL